jgi:hypothetical protein
VFSIFLISLNPSISLLISIGLDLFSYSRVNKTNRLFLDITEEAEKEMEEKYEQVTIAIVEEKAYWVLNNIFYEADIVNNEVDRDTSRPIDAFKMSNGDVTKMLYILDNLEHRRE